ncbi:MAG: site-2 protease family protein [Planctomycetes bacterium]|nr:site-2 protease family protein [Planctomycetota bacterium]
MGFDFTLAVTWYLALIVAMTFHEAAHALVAKIGGDTTAYEAGQVTLNPVAHMRREPFDTIVLPIISLFLMGFPLGFAHAPYNPYWADAHPKRAALMSLAGPVSNLLLATLIFALMKVGISAGVFEYPLRGVGIAAGSNGMAEISMLAAPNGETSGILYAFARILPVFFFINLLLGTFNLIPVPPLDGAGIAEGMFPTGIGRFFGLLRREPTFGMIGLIIAWYLFPKVWWPVWDLAITLYR